MANDTITHSLVNALHNNVLIEVHRRTYFGVATITFNGWPVIVIDLENSSDDNVLWDWLGASNPAFESSMHDMVLLTLVEIGALDYDHYEPWLQDMDQASFDEASSHVRDEGHGVLQFIEGAYNLVKL